MKTRSRRGNPVDDDRDTESDENSGFNIPLKRKLPYKVTDHIQKFGGNGLQRLQNHLPPDVKRELQNSRDDDPKSPVATSSHSNSNEMFMNGSENDPKQFVRRSTRQRKFMYDNLNQTWLLASSIPDFAKLEPLFSNEQRSAGEEQCVSLRPRRSERNHSYELRRLGMGADGLDFEDMYSRVKRKRRKSVHSFYSRRISQDGGSMADTEDTDHNGMSDSDTIDDRSDLEEGIPEGMAIPGKQREGRVIDSVVHGSKYSLRPKKPITERFQFPIEPVRPRRSATATIFEATQHHQRPRDRETFKSTAHRSPLFKRKRHAIHNSTSSSSDDERRFEKRKAISMARARNRCLPLNFIEDDLTKGAIRDRVKIGSSLADIDPMSIDKTVSFDHIGGLDKHIRSLKEMVLFPLMYPEVFQRFKIAPPRGVLFYGQPGTGKTLVARALANECSTGDKRVAFFMRKGADCLSKWVGESERQLRLLFDQAYSMRPSIIFFDEIDGLAPVRSTRQDQIHSSIVSTLLALMDGLDNRGEIVIIGATNRLDAIDPALRRPGRFDRELLFPLPSVDAREMILKIMMKEWYPPQPDSLMSELAVRTAGYCGADLKALCSEAALVALRRRYPQIYNSKQKLQLDVETIQVTAQDFVNALKKMKPSMQRTTAVSAKPLITILKPLLDAMLQTVVSKISKIFPLFKINQKRLCDTECLSEDSDSSFIHDDVSMNCLNNLYPKDGLLSTKSILPRSTPFVHRPYFLLSGKEGQGQGSLAPALLYLLEGVSVNRMDIPALYAVTCRAPEEACAQIFLEAQRNLPSVIFLPHIGYWWETLSETVRATFLSLLHDLDPSTPLMIFATSDVTFDKLPRKIQDIFGASSDQVFLMRNPNEKERKRFFSSLYTEIYHLPKKPAQKANHEELPVAVPPPVRKLTTSELNKLRQREEATLRELRLFLRDILTKLARDRRFSVFSRPVDPDEVPDYEEVIKNPMDLETMMTKIDSNQYETVSQFLSDVDLVCHNALEYNPDRDPSDKMIRHRACSLRDVAHALVLTELDDEFEKICLDIRAARKERGESPAPFVPKRHHVISKTIEAEKEPIKECNTVKITTPPSQETSGSLKSPSREKRASLSSEVSPTRFSKRIRGMGAPSLSSDAQHAKSYPSPKRSARYIIWRRKKSPWFGSCRRKLIRRTNKCVKKGPVAKKYQINSKIKKISEPLCPAQEENIPVGTKYPNLNPSINVPVPHDERREMSGTDSSATIISPKTDNPPSNISLDRDFMSHEVATTPVAEDVNFGESIQHSTSKFNSQVSCDISVDFNCSRSSLRSCTPIILSIKSPRKQSPLKGHEAKNDSVPIAEIEMEVETSSFVLDQETRGVTRQIVIDTVALENFMDHVLRVTEGCTVERLLQLYSMLQQCICKHRKELNKQDLMNDLERTVDCFSHHKPS